MKMTASLAYDQALFALNWPFAAAISTVLLFLCVVVLGLYTRLVRRWIFLGVFQRNAPLG